MEKQTMDFPTAAQLTEELKRIRYRKGFRKMLRSTISSLLVVAAVAVLISMLFLPVLRVTGTSMTPTLTNDELVICGKRSNFKSGDVVAFYFNNKILLKRVIGVAGDVIDIKEDGTVYVNGTALEEPYVNELAFGECDLELPYQVPESRIFVMGDPSCYFCRQPFECGWLYCRGICCWQGHSSGLAIKRNWNSSLI